MRKKSPPIKKSGTKARHGAPAGRVAVSRAKRGSTPRRNTLGNTKKAAATPKGRSAPRGPSKAPSGRGVTEVDSRQVLFVQGAGKGTHDEWDNKLVASLKGKVGPRYTIRYPRMPEDSDPDPTTWKKGIARELGELGDGVLLIGHSIGAAILLDYLGDGAVERRPAAVFLIAAPFIGDGGWPSDGLRPTKRVAAELHDGPPLHFYQGGDDDTVPSSHIDMFAAAFPQAIIRRLEGRDHQLNDDLSEVAQDIKRLE